MPNFVPEIALIRQSVVAVLKINPAGMPSAGAAPQFNVGFVGTAWCIVTDRIFVTANHIWNATNPRDPAAKYYAFFNLGNGPAWHATVIFTFSLEDAANDISVFEIAAVPAAVGHVPGLSISFDYPPDGTDVLTYGCPAPSHALTVDVAGNLLGGGARPISNANEGIVAAQYADGAAHFFDFNVDWHHGESGGPIACLGPLRVFSLMQDYLPILTPHGTHPGPHRGRSLKVIEAQLRAFGATVV